MYHTLWCDENRICVLLCCNSILCKRIKKKSKCAFSEGKNTEAACTSPPRL